MFAGFLVGATADGTKELIVLHGFRESELMEGDAGEPQSTRPAIRTTAYYCDGALGFWKALEKAFPTTRGHLCAVHKAANVPD